MDAIVESLIFVAAVWVLCACVWRLKLMQWGRHQCAQLAAYILLGLWALSHVLHLPEFGWLGVVGVALLFFGGRRRWLTRAPDDTARCPR